MMIEFSCAAFPVPRAPCTLEPFQSPKMPAAKAKGKGKAKAKAEPAAKKQKTCATADTVPEEAELEGTIVLANAGMGPLQFHRAATKMRNLLKYCSSERCRKAYIYTYVYI